MTHTSKGQIPYCILSFGGFVACSVGAYLLNFPAFYWGSGFALGITLLNIGIVCQLKLDESRNELNEMGIHYIGAKRFRLVRENIED